MTHILSDILVICKRTKGKLGKGNREKTKIKTPSRANSGRNKRKEDLIFRVLIHSIEVNILD